MRFPYGIFLGAFVSRDEIVSTWFQLDWFRLGFVRESRFLFTSAKSESRFSRELDFWSHFIYGEFDSLSNSTEPY